MKCLCIPDVLVQLTEVTMPFQVETASAGSTPVDGIDLYELLDGLSEADVAGVATRKRKATNDTKCSCEVPAAKRINWFKLTHGMPQLDATEEMPCLLLI